MIAALEQQLREIWGALDAGPPPTRIHVAKLSHGDYPPPSSPFVFFLFADDAALPVAVAKVARGAAGDALVAHEIAALRAVHERLPVGLRSDIPGVLFARPVNGRAAVLLRALDGELELHHTWGARRAVRCAARMRAALDWIHAAGEATGGGTITGAEWFGMAIAPALARLAALGCDAARLDSSRRERVEALWECTWPAGLVHGDFFPGNLLFGAGDAVRVVDWSTSAAQGARCADPITYELSFHAATRAATGRLDRREVEAVHALPAFAVERERWSARGVDLGLGSAARLATLLWLALRDGAPDTGRGPIGATWAALLKWHLEEL